VIEVGPGAHVQAQGQLQLGRVALGSLRQRLLAPTQRLEPGLVAAAKEVAKLLVAAVEAAGVGGQKPLHAGGEVGLRGFDYQMKMVGHEAKGVDLPAGLGAGLPKGFQEERAVLVGFENGLVAVAAIHDVVDGVRVLEAEFSGHGAI
jgi:hypothetical protein